MVINSTSVRKKNGTCFVHKSKLLCAFDFLIFLLNSDLANSTRFVLFCPILKLVIDYFFLNQTLNTFNWFYLLHALPFHSMETIML